MKRKSLTMILCLLTCLSLVGVGFAAWVISSGDSEFVSGNITVDTVTDRRFNIADVADPDNVYYGLTQDTAKIAEYNISNPWLVNNTSGSKENLVISFDVVISSNSELVSEVDPANTGEALWEEHSDISINFAIAAGQDAWDAALAGKAIAEPKVEKTVKSADSSSITYTVTLTFYWGEAFDPSRNTTAGTGDADSTNNLNPYLFYNEKTSGGVFVRDVETWGDDAKAKLQLVEALGAVKYNVTINVTPAA